MRQHPHDPNRWFFDFDAAAPGGRGGASLLVDPPLAFVSIDGVHKNDLLPPRSTGGLLAEGLKLIGLSQPATLEGYNVERTTAFALAGGSDGQGTRIGYLLRNAALALGGTIDRWEPIQDGNIWHLRLHLIYP